MPDNTYYPYPQSHAADEGARTECHELLLHRSNNVDEYILH